MRKGVGEVTEGCVTTGRCFIIILAGCSCGVSTSHSTALDGCERGGSWTPRSPHAPHIEGRCLKYGSGAVF